MPQTRSKTQPKLEDLPSTTTESTSKNSPNAQKPKQPTPAAPPKQISQPESSHSNSSPPRSSQKRKASPTKASSPRAKVPRSKPRPVSEQQHIPSSNALIASHNQAEPSTSKNHETITINRAPVLHLWTACVADVVLPEDVGGDVGGEGKRWEICLNVGAAVSALCAVSKGKALGMIGKGDKEKDGDEGKGAKKSEEGLRHVQVMGFDLPLKDGVVRLSGKPKPAGEDGLKRKFGAEQYEAAKKMFEEVLGDWKGQEEELGKKAFGFYENFRPDVGGGTAGWGRSGVLDLEKVRNTVGRRERGQVSMEEMVEGK